jgi:hypothetical protein
MRSKIIELVFTAIDEINKQLPPRCRLAKNEASVIAGSDGILDSLAILNLIVTVEGLVDNALHTSIGLASALMESEGQLPHTVGALADLITSRLEGATRV